MLTLKREQKYKKGRNQKIDKRKRRKEKIEVIGQMKEMAGCLQTNHWPVL